MTGYGRGSYQGKGILVEVEVRSVNHRFLEANLHLPRFLIALEPHIRRKLKEACHRGKLDLYFIITPLEESPKTVEVDTHLAKAMWKAMEEVAKRLGRKEELNLSLLFSRQEIFSVSEKEQDPQVLRETVEKALEKALDQLLAHRVQEGEKLKEDLSDRLNTMGKILDEIRERASHLPLIYKEKLQKRLEELQAEVSPERVAQEAAIIAERINITEEIVRLDCHLEAFRKTLEEGSPCGKKLDFLAQEILRETNTIASKGQDTQVAHLVVDLKGEIEKIREQVQNIE